MQKNDTAKSDPFLDRQIDLNLNIGEGYGSYKVPLEEDLLDHVTSVNVSTGAHSGDPFQINESLKRCKEKGSHSVGALISYPDVFGYGLRKIELTEEELRTSIIAQLGALASLAKINGFELEHVRPHGYLYNQLASNTAVAETVAKAVQEFSSWLILVGPAGSILDEVSSWTSIRVSPEARVDLRYKEDGSLFDFNPEKDGDLGIDTITERARNLIYKGIATTDDRKEIKLKFETINIPNNLKNSIEIAKLINGMLVKPMPLKSIDYEPYLSELI